MSRPISRATFSAPGALVLSSRPTKHPCLRREILDQLCRVALRRQPVVPGACTDSFPESVAALLHRPVGTAAGHQWKQRRTPAQTCGKSRGSAVRACAEIASACPARRSAAPRTIHLPDSQAPPPWRMRPFSKQTLEPRAFLLQLRSSATSLPHGGPHFDPACRELRTELGQLGWANGPPRSSNPDQVLTRTPVTPYAGVAA